MDPVHVSHLTLRVLTPYKTCWSLCGMLHWSMVQRGERIDHFTQRKERYELWFKDPWTYHVTSFLSCISLKSSIMCVMSRCSVCNRSHVFLCVKKSDVSRVSCGCHSRPSCHPCHERHVRRCGECVVCAMYVVVCVCYSFGCSFAGIVTDWLTRVFVRSFIQHAIVLRTGDPRSEPRCTVSAGVRTVACTLMQTTSSHLL